jgi:hypothetical protein
MKLRQAAPAIDPAGTMPPIDPAFLTGQIVIVDAFTISRYKYT